MKIADETCTLEVEIQSARVNPIRLTTDCFSVAVKDAEGKQRYLSLTNGGVQIKSAENLQLQKKKSTKVQLAAIGFPKELEEGDTVIFKFIPVRENSEMSLTWEISKEEYENAITEKGCRLPRGTGTQCKHYRLTFEARPQAAAQNFVQRPVFCVKLL